MAQHFDFFSNSLNVKSIILHNLKLIIYKVMKMHHLMRQFKGIIKQIICKLNCVIVICI